MSEKIQALVHQTWLNYGGTVEKVREANTRVRQVLTDMGTEAAIADAHDVVAECLDQGHEARALSWLYPLAPSYRWSTTHPGRGPQGRRVGYQLVEVVGGARQEHVPVVEPPWPSRGFAESAATSA